MDGGWIRRVGQGNVFGAFLVMFGLGGGKGFVYFMCTAKGQTLALSTAGLIGLMETPAAVVDHQ